MNDLPLANTMNYWQTGRSSPDVWIERTIGVVSQLGGTDIQEAFGSAGGRAAYMLAFTLNGELYKVVWPVLPTERPEQQQAARVQAATMLYHDCKAKALAAKVLGARTVFFHALMLPDGRTVGEVATPALAQVFPTLIGYER